MASGTVVVDATLGVSDGRRLRAQVDALNKPLLAVLVTHVHPDHYGGIASLLEGSDVPVYASAGVVDATCRDDAAKEQILRPMFGSEWPVVRRFPDSVVQSGEGIMIGDDAFTLIDLGPGESPHDSIWCVDTGGPLNAFVGDLVYSQMHAYLADGFYEAWLRNLERARHELPADTRIFMGHGEPVTGHDSLDRQRGYIDHFLDTLRTSVERDGLHGEALVDAVAAHMEAWLGRDDLLFLLRLSVEPMRARLGLPLA
jgi:glyoxylase-like metal-dependent hydrolase (beta-lactamase superfamily II)